MSMFKVPFFESRVNKIKYGGIDMCDRDLINEIRNIVNETVRHTLSEMFSEFEQKTEKSIANTMNTTSNSFEYIAKMLENSGVFTSNIDKQKIAWQTDMKNVIYELMRMDKKSFPTYNSVIKLIYSTMWEKYFKSHSPLMIISHFVLFGVKYLFPASTI